MQLLFKLNLWYIYWNFVFSVVKRFYDRIKLIALYYFLWTMKAFSLVISETLHFVLKKSIVTKCTHEGEGGTQKTYGIKTNISLGDKQLRHV